MAFLNIAPTGTVLPFAGSTAPEGWLICNGSSQSTTTYAKLFAVIGYTYGGTGGSFNLPDMQGVFPRGAGTNLTANYGGVTGHTPAGGSLASKGGQKTGKNGLSSSTTNFPTSVSGAKNQMNGTSGGMSDNSTLNHSGTYSGTNTAIQLQLASGTLGYEQVTIPSHDVSHTHGWDFGSATFSASGSATAQAITTSGDTETTPAFLTLNYIIKL